MNMFRTRWAALGAAVAVTLGAGGIGLAGATSPAEAVTFIPITPCRVIDTRPAPDTVGAKSSPLGAGEIHTVETHGDNGDCTGIPNEATAVSLNVTAIGATQPTFLTIWAADATQPESSSLNPVPGAPPTPNAVTTELNGDGEFSIYNLQGNVDVLADINGYYVDHHHDDRYYTKAEIDGAAAATIVARGFVTSGADPNLLNEVSIETIETEFVRLSLGRTSLTMTGIGVASGAANVMITPHSTTAAHTCKTDLISVAVDNTVVVVECFLSDGSLVDSAYQYIVVN